MTGTCRKDLCYTTNHFARYFVFNSVDRFRRAYAAARNCNDVRFLGRFMPFSNIRNVQSIKRQWFADGTRRNAFARHYQYRFSARLNFKPGLFSDRFFFFFKQTLFFFKRTE